MGKKLDGCELIECEEAIILHPIKDLEFAYNAISSAMWAMKSTLALQQNLAPNTERVFQEAIDDLDKILDDMNGN